MKVSPAMVYGGAALLGLAILYKFAGVLGKGAAAAADVAGGIATGNNAVTQSATNAAGERVTAYEGAGIVGTVGAATNATSGGVLASVGESLGGWWASVTGADKDAEIAAMLKGQTGTAQTAAQSQFNRPPITSSSDSSQAANLTTYSMLSGQSFKDMASAQGVNYFNDPTTYGGGLSLR